MTDEQFLDYAEACRYLDVHRCTLSRRVSAGLIEYHADRVDRRKRLFARADLDALKINIPAE